MPLLNLSDVQTLGMHQHGGVMSPLVEVYDGDHDDPLAYIQYKRRPLRGCATIMLAVLIFFTFPVAVGFMAHALSQATGMINPLGMDQQQSIVLTVVAWIVVVSVGILATMFTIRLTSPRRRTTIFTDHERQEPLIEFRQDHLDIYGTVTFTIDGLRDGILGSIRHHHRRDQYEIIDPHGQTLAVLSSTGGPAESIEATSMAIFLLFFIVAIGWFAVILLPRQRTPQRKYSLWHRDSPGSRRKEEIGRFDFNSTDRDQNRIYLSRDELLLPDRRLVLALSALLATS